MSKSLLTIISGKERSVWEWQQERLGMVLNGWGFAVKKTFKNPIASAEAQADFQRRIDQHIQQGKTLVYIDESGFAQDSPRTHGYAPQGSPCFGHHRWQIKGRINAIGAIIGFSFLALGLFQGSINSDVFYAWVTQALIPVLPENAVVVMDNASFHKRADILMAFKGVGAEVEFLPPYSPEFNPIEHKWAQAKSILKRERCDV